MAGPTIVKKVAPFHESREKDERDARHVVSALRPDLGIEVAAMAVPSGARRVAPSDHDERGRA